MTKDTFIVVVAIIGGTLTRYAGRRAHATDKVAIGAFFAGLLGAAGVAWLIREPLGPTGRLVVAVGVIVIFLAIFARPLLQPRRR